MLTVEGLSVSYGEKTVLQQVGFHLAAGQVLAVIGPNGAGKSTLIRALSGVLPVRGGAVRLDGRDLRQYSEVERARRIAVVPQAVNLPAAFTVWETVLLGRTPHLNWLGQLTAKDEDIARWALERTDTQALAGRPVNQLSGGEQQRVLLARALAQSAPVMLLDEPTAHLDLQYQLSLLELVRELAHQEKLAVLVALHDLNLVSRYADKVALLAEGKLCALGRPGEVLQADVLTRAYRVPLQVLALGGGLPPVVLPAG
ncbi:heme ABC transporter ATP-binding protein [Levilinea saccharolytica]|uniref:ABC-type cobalamin/Fe3+-siderophores transport system, ATPase component n=1 Tax=Levilinea saccharolytica TaxID=229921 RepID=A0A0M8JPQ1_9CHLR|nr:heme ABC transporter ATP-binding protein [Levilinea saccharolytica]KPL91559.1 hypothetical protein ADN01_01165 [Levilinea saccharolytica]GAP19109.1 ABC-type cobalamin/Fe3+-siderophores transport system, ATPase component [Levilinea saccharolytica]